MIDLAKIFKSIRKNKIEEIVKEKYRKESKKYEKVLKKWLDEFDKISGELFE